MQEEGRDTVDSEGGDNRSRHPSTAYKLVGEGTRELSGGDTGDGDMRESRDVREIGGTGSTPFPFPEFRGD